MLEIKRGGHVGPYKVIKPLEEEVRGAMATLFLAQLVRLEGAQLVVLKVVSAEEEGAQERLNALRKEVGILQKLRHPNIVKIYPIPSRRRGEHYISRATNVPGNPWFCALEYLKGGDLRSRLHELESLPLEEAVEIAYQVGSALDYMHSKGYVHWDVKPENISFRYDLSEGGMIEAVLTDFGIARGTHEPAEVTGTVDYMAPERLKVHMGEIPPDQITDQRPADVYALGVVLYEMLAGSRPFVAEDEEALKYAILEEPPIPLTDFKPEVPAVVEDVIFQALAKDPANRPTMEEMVTMLDRAVPLIRIGVPTREREEEEEEVEEEKPKEVAGPKRPPILRFLQWTFAIAIVVALAMALFVGGGEAVRRTLPWLIPPTPTPVVTTLATPTPKVVEVVVTSTPEPSTPTPTPTATGTPTPTPTSMPTQTPTLIPTRIPPTSTPPKASPLTLISPEWGETLYGRGPKQFRWQGRLGPGQTYQVHARSSLFGVEVKSPSLSAPSWTTRLPADAHGEWQWKVSVLWDGSEIATSNEGMFWFQPYGGGEGGEGKETITPPAP